MKKNIGTIITALIVITLIVLCFVFGSISLSENQLETLFILLIVCGSSALYCFIVGELTRNNSQMDKLWSLIPIAYTWIITVRTNLNPRTMMFAILVTIWGIRLTINFARKGAYSIKFWSGEEDYRWRILRDTGAFKNKFVWALFDLFFISIYQNALVLAICLPSLMCMESVEPLGMFDYLGLFLTVGFILLETVADEQQMYFHTTKRKLLSEGKKLEELPEPYNKGFNTTGLWGYARHPNYFAEQAIWLCLYLFVVGAKTATYLVFNWTLVGPLLLVFLFLGSSSLGEKISESKYPEYHIYVEHVSKYVPFRKYRPEKYER